LLQQSRRLGPPTTAHEAQTSQTDAEQGEGGGFRNGSIIRISDRKATGLQKHSGIERTIKRIGDGQLNGVGAGAQIQCLSGKYLGETIVLDVIEDTTVRRVVVDEFVAVVAAARRIVGVAATDVVHGHRGVSSAWDNGDVHPVYEKRKRIVKTTDVLVVLLGSEDVLEEQAAGAGGEVELEYVSVVGIFADEGAEVSIVAGAGESSFTVAVLDRRKTSVATGKEDAVADADAATVAEETTLGRGTDVANIGDANPATEQTGGHSTAVDGGGHSQSHRWSRQGDGQR